MIIETRLYTIAAILLTALSCSNSKSVNSHTQNDQAAGRQLQILNHQAVCVDMDQHLCMLVRDKQTDDWDFFYGVIKGFEYQWGYDYTIEVEPLNENAGMADDAGGDLKYIKTIAKTKVPPDYTFEILLKDENIDALKKKNDNTYALYDAISVSVDGLDSDQLDQLSTYAGSAKGIFKHGSENNQIILTQIKFN